MTATAAVVAVTQSRVRTWAVVLLAASLTLQSGLTAWLLRVHLPHRALWLEAGSVPLYLGSVLLLAVSRLPLRTGLAAVVLTGAALQVCAIQNHPVSSDDDYRYVWDAKVQLHGTDPYRYPPSAPELDGLRDGFLFRDPATSRCNPFPGGCTKLNRPTARTVYPPLAQAAFDVVHLASFGDHGQHVPLQVAAALGAVGVSLLLARRGTPAWRVALWAWCPVTVVECANNAHIDWLGVLLAVLGLQLYASGRCRWAGALVGAATAVKLYPALVGAGMLRRRPLRVVAAAGGVFALSYLPHVLAVGTGVVGYLPMYLQEEHYGSGGRFLVLAGLLPPAATQAAVALVPLAVGVAVALRADAGRPEAAAAVLVGVTFALVSPAQSWYALLLLALVVMTGWVGLLPLVLVDTLVFLSDGGYGLDLARDARYARGALLLCVLVLAVHLVVHLVLRRRRAPALAP